MAYIKSDIDYKRVDEDIDASVLLLTINDSFDLDQIVGIYRPFKMLSNISRLAHFYGQKNRKIFKMIYLKNFSKLKSLFMEKA